MPLPEIIHALAELERQAIPQAQVYEDLPESLGRLPAILNTPGEGSIPFGERDVTYPVHHAVDVHVVVSRADQPASLQQVMGWIEALRAAIDRDHTLGGTVLNSGVSGYRLASLQYAGTTYITLVITVKADELVVAGEVKGA